MKGPLPDTTWWNHIEIVGGHPAVDFVNTVHARLDPAARDYLETPAHVVGWCLRQNLIDEDTARSLTRLGAASGARLLDEARTLRNTLDTMLQARLEGRSDTTASAGFNGELQRLGRWRMLVEAGAGFAWQYRITPAHPQSLLAPLAFAAAELMVSPNLTRLKMCPMEACRWLFLDYSRNTTRTWCSMKTCGNVAKLRRYRARKKAKKRTIQ